MLCTRLCEAMLARPSTRHHGCTIMQDALSKSVQEDLHKVSMPGNSTFNRRIEFADLIDYYLPRPWSSVLLLSYLCYVSLTLITYLIQTAQILDFLLVDCYGCAPGLSLSNPVGMICGDASRSSTPFGAAEFVISFSMVCIVLLCLPCSLLNLDDNIGLQWLAIIGLTLMSGCWLCFLVAQDSFPQPLPTATNAQSDMIGTESQTSCTS